MFDIAAKPAVEQLVAVTEDYMMLPIDVGFNWRECFAAIDVGAWYLVVFRSKHRADADECLLTRLDNDAAEAARGTPGFHYYFIGTPRVTGECLSFCLWDNQSSAKLGAAHSAHRNAMELGIKFYEYYTLERYVIQKSSDGLSFSRL